MCTAIAVGHRGGIINIADLIETAADGLENRAHRCREAASGKTKTVRSRIRTNLAAYLFSAGGQGQTSQPMHLKS